MRRADITIYSPTSLSAFFVTRLSAVPSHTAAGPRWDTVLPNRRVRVPVRVGLRQRPPVRAAGAVQGPRVPELGGPLAGDIVLHAGGCAVETGVGCPGWSTTRRVKAEAAGFDWPRCCTKSSTGATFSYSDGRSGLVGAWKLLSVTGSMCCTDRCAWGMRAYFFVKQR